MDPRVTQLAEQLITYSVKLQPGEKIYIEIKGLEAMDLGRELVRVATLHGGVPFWYYNDEDLSRGFVKQASEKQFKLWAAFHRKAMENSDCYIAILGSSNPFDHKDVDAERMNPQAVLRYPIAVAEPGRAGVAGAGIDLRKAVAHGRIPSVADCRLS